MVWANSEKKKECLIFLENKKGNVFLLQETRWPFGIKNTVRSQWGCECVFVGHDSGSKDVAVLFKNNFEYKIRNVLRDNEGRYILIDIKMMNKRLTLANIYAPNSGDHPVFDTVIREIVAMDNELIVIGGDWNVAPNPKIDKSS